MLQRKLLSKLCFNLMRVLFNLAKQSIKKLLQRKLLIKCCNNLRRVYLRLIFS